MSEAASPQRLYLDTNVFIYAVQGAPDVASPLQEFLQAARGFALRPVTSELTLAELLCKAKRSLVTRRIFMNLLVYNDLVELKPVTRETLMGSADLRRGNSRYRLADAIHAQTAIDARCTLLMTNDHRFGVAAGGVTLVKPDAAGIRHVLDSLHG